VLDSLNAERPLPDIKPEMFFEKLRNGSVMHMVVSQPDITWNECVQRAEVLFDDKLPEVFRLSLAKSVQDDLFSKVCSAL